MKLRGRISRAPLFWTLNPKCKPENNYKPYIIPINCWGAVPGGVEAEGTDV